MKRKKNYPEYHRDREMTGKRLYARERPKECKFCYFWKDKRSGCILGGEENCYYLLHEPEKEPSPCDGCPYGRARPCVGFCMKNILGMKGGVPVE